MQSPWPGGTGAVPVPAAPTIAPGAYPDPWDPGRLRWWDGRAWTAQTSPPAPRTAASRMSVPARVLGPGAVVAFSVTGVASLVLLVASTGLVAFAVATVVAVLPLPLYAWAVLALDRFHPEPRSALIWTFLAGATVVVLWALIANTLVEAVLLGTVGSTASQTLTATVVAPVVEESGKAVVLVLLYRRFRHQISGPLDGIIYAAMVGLGFATVENVLYYGSSVADGSLPLVFVLRGVLSPFAHPVFTAFTGIGLGLLAAGRTRLGVLAPVLGVLGAMLAHGLWNGSTQLGALGVLGVFFGVMVPVFCGLLVLCRKEAGREKRTLREQLRPEVSAGVLSETDVAVLSEVRPRKLLIQAAKALHPQAGAAAQALAADLLELANTRERIAGGAFSPRYGDPQLVVAELEARVARSRWALPPAPPGAAWAGLSGALGLPVPRLPSR
jgi:RsiW-degrading membrane proteinase PrsW (M82 family)